jgi:hypothetical protein
MVQSDDCNSLHGGQFIYIRYLRYISHVMHAYPQLIANFEDDIIHSYLSFSLVFYPKEMKRAP